MKAIFHLYCIFVKKKFNIVKINNNMGRILSFSVARSAGDPLKRKLFHGTTISIDKETQKTDIGGLFASGDAANGPGAVMDVIVAGRRAASSMDHLGVDGVIGTTLHRLTYRRTTPKEKKALPN